MIPVEIEYRPFSFIPWTIRVEKKLPVRWSELSQEQISFIPFLNSGTSDRMLLEVFLGLRKGIAKRMDDYQAFCIARLLKFLSAPEPLDRFMVHKIAGFKAPGRGLKGVTFGAFIFGDSYFQSYMEGKESSLDLFIASFYTGRRGFDENMLDKNAIAIRKKSMELRQAIAINYGLIREWLAITYPFVFQKPESGKKDNTKGWVGVFDILIKDDLANQDKYATLPVSTVLRNLNNRLANYYKNGGEV